MIKIFRQIRQRLFSENRFRKYILYAIGEIALVMIGILLALQVNNWNENRKNQALINNYTENLIEDLTIDSINISKILSNINEDIVRLADIKERVQKSEAILDTILKIARFEYRFYIAGLDNYNNNTYKALNSTGDIALFDKKIIHQLNALNNLQELALNQNYHTFESYRSNVHEYAKKYPVPFEYNLFESDGFNTDGIWNNVSKYDHATEFNALIIAKGDAYRLSNRNLPEILDRTIELLHVLR